MKKYILGAVLAVGIFVSPAFTEAAGLTTTQVQAILTILSSFGADSATIANVSASLTGGSPTSTGATAPFCHDFYDDLTIGSTDKGAGNVSALNRALMLSGIEPSGNTFDEGHASGVVQFQAKYGIRQTGYVGPATRAKLNALYGCSNSQTNQNGQTMNVTSEAPMIYNVNGKGGFGTGDSNQIIGQRLSRTTSVYLVNTSSGAKTTLSYSVIDDTRLNVVVPSVPGGTYTLYVVNPSGTVSAPVGYLGAQTTATRARYLTIRYVSGVKEVYTPGETFPLVIKGTEQTVQDNNPATPAEGFNVQVYLREANGASNLQGVNATYNPQTGYWNTQLTAPTDTTKKYIVESFLYCSNSSLACGQRYSTADSMGQVGAAFGLNFSAAPTTTTTPVITSLSVTPSTVSTGGTVTVHFTSANTNYCHVYLDSGPTESTLDEGYTASKGYADKTISWPAFAAAGTHSVLVYCWNKDGAADNKSAQFTVSPGSTATNATSVITVTSPNGGEVWQKGTVHTIQYGITNNPINHVIGLRLLKGGVFSQNLSSPAGTITTGPYGQTGASLSWTVPSTLPEGSDYTVQAVDYASDGVTVVSQDSSNASFTIAAATVSTAATPANATVTANGSIIANNGTITIPAGTSVTLGWNTNVVGATTCSLSGTAISTNSNAGTSGAMFITGANAGSYTYACTGMNPFYFSVVAAPASGTTTTTATAPANGTITSNNIPIANNGTITIPANTSATLGWNSNVVGTTSCTLASDAIGGTKNAGTSGAMTITGANAGSYTYACTGMNPFYFSVAAIAAPISNANVTANGSTVANGGTITVPYGDSVTLWWNSNAGTSSSCSLASSVAGARVVPYSGSTSVTAATAGSYTFACTGMNTFYFKVLAGAAPTPAPAATLDQPSQSATVAQPTISGTATVDRVFVNLGMYNNPIVTGTATLTVTNGRWSGALIAPVNNGTYDVKVYDAATHTLLATGSLSVAVNTSATISLGQGSDSAGKPTLVWSANANAASCSYRVNGGAWGTLSPLSGSAPLTGIGLVVGTTYTLEAYCLNSAGQPGPYGRFAYTPTVAFGTRGTSQVASAAAAFRVAMKASTATPAKSNPVPLKK